MLLKIFAKLRAWWKPAASAAHFAIATIAALAYAQIIHMSKGLLAILIAWANLCAALHHATNDKKEPPQ